MVLRWPRDLSQIYILFCQTPTELTLFSTQESCFFFHSHENTDNISCPHAVKSTCVHTLQVYSIINIQGWN